MDTLTLATDPAALIESLDPERIRAQLAELERQSRALRVLLRSALARERAADRRTPRGEVRLVD